MNELDVELVPADQVLLEERSELSSSVGAPFYSRPEWFIPWAKAFNQGYLHCLTARRRDQLVALMPVIPQGGMVRAAVNGETRTFCPLLTDSVNLLQVITAIPSRWRRVSLAYVPATMFTGRNSLNHSAKRRVITQELRHSPFLDTEGAFTSWENARLSSSHRGTMRRRQRRLSELGELSFEISDGRQRLTALVDEGFALEASGWKGRAGTAIRSRPAVHAFYRDFASLAAELGILRLLFLRLDGRPIAFQLAIEDQHVMSSLKTAFDEQYRACSPGVLINRAAIQYCFAHPDIQRFDFHGEAEKAKLEWTDSTDTQIRAEIFSTGVPASVERSAIHTAWGHETP
jgi:Acetyltransferase (GNAT) domain